MKQQVSPAVAAILVVVVVGVAVLAYMKFGTISHSGQPPSMPESAAKQWQQMSGGAAPGKGGTTGPAGSGTIPGVGQMTKGGGSPGMPAGGLPNMGMVPPGSPR